MQKSEQDMKKQYKDTVTKITTVAAEGKMSKTCVSCGSEIDDNAEVCIFCMQVQPKKSKAPKINPVKKERVLTPEEVEEKVTEQEEAYPKRKIKKVTEKPAVSVDSKPSVDKAVQSVRDRGKAEKEKNERLAELEKQAHFDAITGLQNRTKYEMDLKLISQSEMCAISIDVNYLKKTNDEYGHKYGDLLLQSVAESMKKVFGEEHCYRTGGDEFACLLEGVREKVMEQKLQAFYKEMAHKEEELPEEEKFPISCAIGVAYGDGLHSIKEILELADQRMYENKREMKAERTDNNTSAESPKQDGEFNPNFDGYYNDVEAAIEEEEKEFSKEQFGKALGLIVGTIAFIIIFEIIINSIM